MKKLLYSAIAAAFSFSATAQEGIGYYYDYTNHLYVFDKGNTHEIEQSRVTNIKVGNDYMAYVDEKGSLDIYYASDKQTLEEYAPASMVATAHILVYKMQQRLMICENGNKKLLSRNVGDYYADDSMIVWQALPGLDIMAYTDGQIKTVEPAVSSLVINDGKVGKNVFAYNTLNYNFKVYYKDSVYDTGNSRVSDYQCGKDVVAYSDTYKNTFSVFYKGDILVLSNQVVKNYMVCNDMIAFVDSGNNFFIYYEGNLIKIDSYAPDFYFAQNDIVYYSYNSELKMVYMGKIAKDQLIEQQNIMPGVSSILYSTPSGMPKYFYQGKIISNFYVQKPYTMELSGDLPVFRYGDNTIAFLYDGKIYEFGTRSN